MFERLSRLSVENPVAIHLFTLLVIVAGLFSYLTAPREIFPEFTRNRILVTTIYPGASPEDVEELITVKIEDAIDAVDGVETIESTSQEGVSWVSAYLSQGSDVSRALQDIDRAVAAITDLPEEAEEPVVDEVRTRFPVITLSVYGDLSELALKDLIRPIRRRMEAIPGVSDVRPSGLRELEWHIQVDPAALLRYGVTIEEVARALGAENRNVPGGLIERGGSDVLVRTRGETETVREIEDVVVRARPDGAHLRVGDLAQVSRGFERASTYGRFNAKPALNLVALKDSDGDILEIAAAVRKLAREVELPAGVEAAVHTDLSIFLNNRLQVMKSNAIQGFVLVLASLCALLHWRMAVLVAMGIPIAFLFSFVGMQLLGVSVNMMSLFALILILGMLVDDAIIVTENIYRLMEQGMPPTQAAIQGTAEVATPVLATVLTTVSAFMPMLMTPGEMGQWMYVVPIVVTLCLGGSVVECFAILPCHVAEFARPAPQESGRYHRFLVHYERWVRLVLGRRLLAVAATLGLSLVLVTLAASQLKFVLFGNFESDTYFLNFELPTTASLDESSERARELERVVMALPESERAACITNVGISAVDVNRADRGSYLGQVVFNLTPPAGRARSATQIVDDLRGQVEGLPGFTKLEFKGLQAGPGGAAIEVALEGDEFEPLRQASRELQDWLRSQSGVHDVFDDWAPGKAEVEVNVDREAAAALGLNTAEVARQVRNAFQGREASKVRRVDEDVPLLVRFPGEARAYRSSLEEMWLTLADGSKVPLRSVASVREGRGLARIVRGDRRRAVTVLGDVDTARGNALEITARLERQFRDRLRDSYGVDLKVKGQRREAEQSMEGLVQAFFVSLFLIYFILGTQFRSFLQPVFVMIAIPFGIDGILVGHMLLGHDISFLSMMGLVATSGIVVNDSLVLVDLVNTLRAQGVPLFEAAVQASVRRLRPILLTSITTVLGLAPLAFFASGQARFLSPMAVSITFGISFATVLTLVVIPCLYLLLEDARRILGELLAPAAAAPEAPAPAPQA